MSEADLKEGGRETFWCTFLARGRLVRERETHQIAIETDPDYPLEFARC